MAIEPTSMTTTDSTPAKPPIDWSNSIKESAIAAVVMALITIPVFAVKTDQAMNNVLSLETRWGLVATLTALVFAARLLALTTIWNRPAGAKPVQIIPEGLLAPFAKLGPVAAPLALGFAVVFPFVIYYAQGNGALKWVNNYGIQILIYVMLGWGLNIVVGLAGLLDLGYVAFYAIGAYTYALLATSEPVQLWMAAHIGENFWAAWAFWICLPVAGVLAAFWGIILGFPVLRLRGDYLAIVTLAFGEIIYLVALNWVDFTGGGAGITSIPRVTFFGIPFTPGEDGFAAWLGIQPSPVLRSIFLYFLILGLCLLTAFVTLRLRRLPVGRAWEALREDEIACRSLGINTTNTKLTAFAIGAMFGGFAGAFFSVRQGFVSPDSFKFLESATILAIVVLGGMGSLVGVVLASIAIVGGTELLRELDFLKQVFGDDFDPTQYRMLLVGLAMVLMMLWKPRGLISTREPSVFLKERKAVSGSLVKEGHG